MPILKDNLYHIIDGFIINKMYIAWITWKWIYNNVKTEFINNIKFLEVTKYWCHFEVIIKYPLSCKGLM